MQTDKPMVLVAVPTMGSLHTMLTSRLLLWTKQAVDYDISFYFTFRVSPHDRARNDIVEFFLSNPKMTHLMFIDSDTIPPENALTKLLSHDLPFVTALTPILRMDPQSGQLQVFDNCFLEPTKDGNGNVIKTNITQRDTGMHKIYRCGAACMLIKREVFETLTPPYFKFETDEKNLKHTRSEDIYFCDQMREAGFDLWADSSVYCQHQKDRMI